MKSQKPQKQTFLQKSIQQIPAFILVRNAAGPIPEDQYETL